MGTHPKSPSLLLESKVSLSEHLSANPSLIGDEIINIYDAGDGNLPFLLKILAIEKALSIQTHPDKTMAERLHKEKPDIYKGSSLCSSFHNSPHPDVVLQIQITSQRWRLL